MIARRIIPAALVPRPWDFDLAPGTPDLIPIHGDGPLKRFPPSQETEDESGRPSGDLPPVPSHDNFVPTFPTLEPGDPSNDDETLMPPPGVTISITPPTLRGPPSAEIQLQS